jgi:Plasmid maintenance system antidote protein
MTNNGTTPVLPDYAVSPGDFIQEWLEENDVNAAELARRLDVTPKHVSELLSGKAPLSAVLSIALERVTGTPATLWNRTEAIYREDLARLAECEKLEAQYDEAKRFPLSYLRKYGFLTATVKDKVETVRELLQLLRIGDLGAVEAAWLNPKVAYRKTKLNTDKSYEQATWLALGEHVAGIEDLPDFDRAGLERLLPKLRALTAEPNPIESLEKVKELLNNVGVAFAIIPPVPGAGVYGATRWIAEHPLVQLSARGKSDDQLWFTLFHELGHVLLHGHKTLFVQGSEGKEEDEADNFASTTLIPQEYADRIPTRRNIAAVQELADELGIAPSIVLGQAQRLTQDYGWGHALRVKFEWHPVSEKAA